jgi:hypothetical protein
MTIINGDDPWVDKAPEPLTVSIKPSAEYDSALLVFKGTPSSIRANLAEFFELPAEDVEGKSAWAVFQEAEARARLEANPTSSTKGGGYQKAGGFTKKDKPASKPEPAPDSSTTASDGPSHDEAVSTAAEGLGAETVAEETAAHAHQDILDAIAAATSKRDMVKLTQGDWGKIILRGDTQDPDVAAAFKAKSSTF